MYKFCSAQQLQFALNLAWGSQLNSKPNMRLKAHLTSTEQLSITLFTSVIYQIEMSDKPWKITEIADCILFFFFGCPFCFCVGGLTHCAGVSALWLKGVYSLSCFFLVTFPLAFSSFSLQVYTNTFIAVIYQACLLIRLCLLQFMLDECLCICVCAHKPFQGLKWPWNLNWCLKAFTSSGSWWLHEWNEWMKMIICHTHC